MDAHGAQEAFKWTSDQGLEAAVKGQRDTSFQIPAPGISLSMHLHNSILDQIPSFFNAMLQELKARLLEEAVSQGLGHSM